jgi:hypothetical protein
MKYEGPAFLHPGNRKRVPFFAPAELECMRRSSLKFAIGVTFWGAVISSVFVIRLHAYSAITIGKTLCALAALFLVGYLFDNLIGRLFCATKKYVVAKIIAHRRRLHFKPAKIDTTLFNWDSDRNAKEGLDW